MHEPRTPASLVWLLRDPVVLTRAEVVAAVEKCNFPGHGVRAGDNVAQQGAVIEVQARDSQVLIRSGSTRYSGVPPPGSTVKPQLPIHRGWIALDVTRGPLLLDPEAAFGVLGPLAAELGGSPRVALLVPGPGRVLPMSPELLAGLRGSEPITALEGPPAAVQQASVPAAVVRAAEREALLRWPEFVAAFRQRKPQDIFSAKFPVVANGVTEAMWIRVERIERGTVYGHLDSMPERITGLRRGEPVTGRESELLDWMWKRDEQVHGAFVMTALKQAVAVKGAPRDERPPRETPDSGESRPGNRAGIVIDMAPAARDSFPGSGPR